MNTLWGLKIPWYNSNKDIFINHLQTVDVIFNDDVEDFVFAVLKTKDEKKLRKRLSDVVGSGSDLAYLARQFLQHGLKNTRIFPPNCVFVQK